MIVEAAIRNIKRGFTASVRAPARHIDVAKKLRQLGNEDVCNEAVWVRGFVDEKGEFYDRRAAAYHAACCKQPMLREPNRHLGLYSEDLW